MNNFSNNITVTISDNLRLTIVGGIIFFNFLHVKQHRQMRIIRYTLTAEASIYTISFRKYFKYIERPLRFFADFI